MRRMIVVFAFALLLTTHAALAQNGAEIQVDEITYEHAGIELTGYLAHDASREGPRPGVIVVHEWWGHDAHARRRAEMLAEAGYVGFALDMYGSGKLAEHPNEAREFATAVRSNRDTMLGRFQAAEALLREHELTAEQPLAASGYCFGGSVVLEAARSGADLAMVASFHGALATEHPAGPDRVKADILVFNGADDPLVPAEQIAAFRDEMAAAGVDYTFVDFSGATHSFTNPGADAIAEEFGMPVGYNARADRDSWNWLLAYLNDRL
ncbi:dienelactone hydrolase family protein [Thioalkalivibrio paradoxus]|uniref:Dienelactone hydrolase n=1 Tax=Thioalkalivibrio paradoxus ARh 1 TaxID=713585 RepID=W0DRU8_9GAMM|nr:dienelactone hydrolase family protein [Thioalkalivibrio paradoxus]AHE99590.1 dienelactone hydrolase [Thioalkalivibrio paradoxus ARh 1]